MAAPLVLAVIGAPGSGRSTLAHALSHAIAERTGLATEVADGHAEATWQALATGGLDAAVLVLDGAPVERAWAPHETAAQARALQQQRRCSLNLLMALAPVPSARRPGAAAADAALRAVLLTHRLPWAVVGGGPDERLLQALDAVSPRVREQQAPRRGLFTRLAERQRETGGRWLCSDCDVPECEHRSLALKRAAPRP